MEENDTVLVMSALQGDDDSFRRLVDRHSLGIFRVAYRITGNEQDAEDIVQETFVKAYRRMRQFDHRARFSTWLYRIAVNSSIDWMHKHPRWEELEEETARNKGKDSSPHFADQEDAERRVFQMEVQRQLKTAFYVLTPQERCAFVLRHFEGKPIEEIASVLGLRYEATKNSIFRAVKKMRRALAPLMGKSE